MPPGINPFSVNSNKKWLQGQDGCFEY